MALVHSKSTILTIGGTDLSAYTKESELTQEVDEKDVTVYGQDGHIVRGGLTSGKFTFSGFYDSTAVSGPRAVLNTIIQNAANVTIVRRAEGTGSGKPEDEFSCLLKSYVETNAVEDFVAWSAEATVSGDVDSTPQS